MSHLFDALEIRGVKLRNRIVVSPMCQYSSVEGRANEWHYVHLGSRAVGGAALVVAEAASVTPDGRISPDDLGIWNDSQAESLAPIFRFIEQQGAIAGMQLAHAGRKASTAAPWLGGKPLDPHCGGWSPIWAPSAIAFADGYQTPNELGEPGIRKTVEAFAQAAVRAREAGAKVVEIHAAHGYLIHEFLSPLSNRRTDRYGGSFENRGRLLCEIVDAVRKVWTEGLPLFVRISATDWVDGGWDLEQSVELARRLKRLGVDVVDCSSGGTVPAAQIRVGPGYQVPFAARIRTEANIKTCAVGMITESAQAETIIRTGQADLVMLARELLRDPYWALRAADELHQDGPWPKQYLRAKRRH